MESGVGDAVELLKDLGRHESQRRPRYPLLRGPKIGPMWLRIMVNPGGADIRRVNKNPVAIDVQVRCAIENLGVTDTRDLGLDEAKPVIEDTWQIALRAARIEARRESPAPAPHSIPLFGFLANMVGATANGSVDAP